MATLPIQIVINPKILNTLFAMNEVEKQANQRKFLFDKKVTRRSLLGGAITAATIALVKSTTGQLVPAVVGDPTKTLGTPPGTLGTRSAFEHPVKIPSDTSSRTPLQDLYGMITPSDLHFERHHGGVPVIDPNKYNLV